MKLSNLVSKVKSIREEISINIMNEIRREHKSQMQTQYHKDFVWMSVNNIVENITDNCALKNFQNEDEIIANLYIYKPAFGKYQYFITRNLDNAYRINEGTPFAATISKHIGFLLEITCDDMPLINLDVYRKLMSRPLHNPTPEPFFLNGEWKIQFGSCMRVDGSFDFSTFTTDLTRKMEVSHKVNVGEIITI